MLHRRLVDNQIAIEVTRIPVDEDAAEIEDDDGAAGGWGLGHAGIGLARVVPMRRAVIAIGQEMI
jgi:hypothetical protein